MEKRWCERIPVSIYVIIQHNGNRLGKCKVKDISLRGICLISGPLAFYENTELMIKFPDTGNLSGNSDNINAIVVRNSQEEIGLMFNPTVPEMIASIIKSSRNDNNKHIAATMR